VTGPAPSTLHRRRPGRAVVAAAAVAVALAALITLALVVNARSGWLHTLDQDVDETLNRYIRRNRGQLWFWKGISTVGDPTVFRIAALVGALVLWWRRRRAAALFTVVAVGGTVVLSSVVKEIVGRPRPVLAHPVVATLTSKSFPSGHALTSFVALGVLLVLVLPYLGRTASIVLATVTGLAVVLIGLSRLMIGVLFPTDVVGGWLLGGLWLAVVYALFTPHRIPALPSPTHRIGSSA
jgi:undecaprenyl-diphosphatase